MACKYEGKGAHVGRCMGTKEIDPCPGYDKCKQYKHDYMTNADRIRAMGDKEIAKFLVNIAVGEECVFFCENPKRTVACWDCKRCIAEWLKQPAEDTE